MDKNKANFLKAASRVPYAYIKGPAVEFQHKGEYSFAGQDDKMMIMMAVER